MMLMKILRNNNVTKQEAVIQNAVKLLSDATV